MLGLGTGDLRKLQEFGDFVEHCGTQDIVFGMVPKELVVEPTTELSAILRNELRDFELDLFPKELLKKNPELDGSLVITYSKVYGPADKTRSGQSKEGWKLIFLEGCPTFLATLSKFPESERFEFGSSRIQIWGGERKEEDKQRFGKNPGRNRGGNNANNNNNNNGPGRGWNNNKNSTRNATPNGTPPTRGQNPPRGTPKKNTAS